MKDYQHIRVTELILNMIIPLVVLVLSMAIPLIIMVQENIISSEKRIEKIDEQNEGRVKSEIATLELKRIGPVEIAKIVTTILNLNATWYKELFEQPFPTCKQCSELEYLLILEMAINTKTAYSEKDIEKILPFTKEGNPTTESNLKKIETEYEKKFKYSIPWWWICSKEEKLERLEKAIKTNIPYPDYSNKDFYELGEAIAKYEMQFKRQPPKCRCSDKEFLEYLERAFQIDAPYLTREEEDELKIRLKDEYKKTERMQVILNSQYLVYILELEGSRTESHIASQ
jgi:hypothetical protein